MIRFFCSAAFTIAALSIPAMAQAQRVHHAELICNDGTVLATNDANACRRHAGVRSVTNDRRMAERVEHGKTLPMDDVMQSRRGGMTTAQMMAELHIDHTRNNATARCADGFYYHGQDNRSACSHDGGVSAWYK